MLVRRGEGWRGLRPTRNPARTPPVSIPCLLGAGGMTTGAASLGWEVVLGGEEEEEEGLRMAQAWGGGWGAEGEGRFLHFAEFSLTLAGWHSSNTPLATPIFPAAAGPHLHGSARLLCSAGLWHEPGPSPGGPPGSPPVHPMEPAGRSLSMPPALAGAPPSPPVLQNAAKNSRERCPTRGFKATSKAPEISTQGTSLNWPEKGLGRTGKAFSIPSLYRS